MPKKICRRLQDPPCPPPLKITSKSDSFNPCSRNYDLDAHILQLYDPDHEISQITTQLSGIRTQGHQVGQSQ